MVMFLMMAALLSLGKLSPNMYTARFLKKIDFSNILANLISNVKVTLANVIAIHIEYAV